MRMDLMPKIKELMDEETFEKVKQFLDVRMKKQTHINHANLCKKMAKIFGIKSSTASAAIAAWNMYAL